ncbi:MAG: LLM class flavin-dependent oxidoreductase [Betaproteobacteria bacterium]|nr:LLM class flavin-dependent oxidoreductase [Betaproteobacteria bacterium]
MKIWYFSENPYPAAWKADPKNLRVTLPNELFDPEVGAGLLNRYLDEWELCDELGMNIMINEHHSTPTCLSASVMMPLAMLARTTKRARLLTLGVPIGVRADPVQVAEELSYVDVVTRGRLEMGLVKGYPTEAAPANISPPTITSRFWEAHDLIIKAMTTHDGPFNWESEHFQYRQVNIWPRPYQQPHPPVWTTAFGAAGVNPVADHGYRLCAGFNARNGKGIFDTYRRRDAELGRPAPEGDRFGYMALLAVGHTREQAFERISKIRGYFESSAATSEAYTNPAGYAPVEANVQALLRGQKTGVVRSPYFQRDGITPVNNVTSSIPELISSGAVFAGTPDEVYEQLRDFYCYIGGFGHLLPMMQGGWLSHKDTVDSMTMFSREVLPRLAGFDSIEIERAG